MYCEFNQAYGNDLHDTFQPSESCIKLVNRENNDNIELSNYDNFKNNKKLTHKDCINKMLKDKNGKHKYNNTSVYQHVRKCKYCKKNIDERKNKKNKEPNIIDNLKNQISDVSEKVIKKNYFKEISICLAIIILILIIGFIIMYMKKANNVV